MNSNQIGNEVQNELKSLILTYGVDKIEFGISEQVSNVNAVVKTTIWFNLNRNDNKILYKGCCEKYVLPYDENASGKYVFMKLNF